MLFFRSQRLNVPLTLSTSYESLPIGSISSLIILANSAIYQTSVPDHQHAPPDCRQNLRVRRSAARLAGGRDGRFAIGRFARASADLAPYFILAARFMLRLNLLRSTPYSALTDATLRRLPRRSLILENRDFVDQRRRAPRPSPTVARTCQAVGTDLRARTNAIPHDISNAGSRSLPAALRIPEFGRRGSGGPPRIRSSPPRRLRF